MAFIQGPSKTGSLRCSIDRMVSPRSRSARVGASFPIAVTEIIFLPSKLDSTFRSVDLPRTLLVSTGSEYEPDEPYAKVIVS